MVTPREKTNAPPASFVKLAQRLFNRTAEAEGERQTVPIELRRFAGPLAHAEQLDGLRVAHMTDMHFGRVTPLRAQIAAVELINSEQPDLVAITGDFVCHSQLYLDQLIEVLRQVDAPTFAVLGNHDHWSGTDEVHWALHEAGVEVLTNQHSIIELRHQRLQVVGIDDAYTGHSDVRKATKGLRRDLPVLGLSHIAEQADKLWARHVPLVLSGHTHAGQVTLAGLHELTLGKLAGHKYVHGLYGCRRKHAGHDGGGALYVGAGIGASVIPFRIGERGRREVAMFELGTEPGTFDEHHEEQLAHEGRKPTAKTRYMRAAKVVQRKMRRDGKKR